MKSLTEFTLPDCCFQSLAVQSAQAYHRQMYHIFEDQNNQETVLLQSAFTLGKESVGVCRLQCDCVRRGHALLCAVLLTSCFLSAAASV